MEVPSFALPVLTRSRLEAAEFSWRLGNMWSMRWELDTADWQALMIRWQRDLPGMTRVLAHVERGGRLDFFIASPELFYIAVN